MASRHRFTHFLVGITAAVALAGPTHGCKSPLTDPFLVRKQQEADQAKAADDSKPDAAADETPQTASTNEPATADDLAITPEQLTNDSWFEKVPPPFAERQPTDARWHHSHLDALLKRAPGQRPDLSTLAADVNPVIATNAAILMAHWNVGQPTPVLVATIRNKSARMGLRGAAVEALGHVVEPSPAMTLRGLLPQVAGATPDGLPNPERPTNFDLQADMIRALARHYEPGDEAWFTAAIRSTQWQVRLEGILAWTVVPKMDLPAVAVDLRNDIDPRLRCAALRAIAAHHDPHAMEYLQQALTDRVTDVHVTAIAALGTLGTEEAQALLGRLKSEKSELSRAASITAMAAAGLRADVEAAVKDKSQLVRAAVARSLADAHAQGQAIADQSVTTARELALDGNNEVQRQAIVAVETWPLEQAGPVLLLAIAEGGYTARKEAAKQLARRWPPAIDFPVDAVAERRTAAWNELKQQWTTQFGVTLASAAATARDRLSLSEDRVREMQRLVALLSEANVPVAAQQAAIATLKAAGPDLVLALEQQASTGHPLPPILYDEVLPSVSPVFAPLRRSASNDVIQRRAAASELIAQTTNVVLPSLALDRLTELVEPEHDPVVWRTVLTALADDSRDTAIRLAYVGIGNASVDVRRRACENLARHGSPRHVAVLLPALEDPDGTVVAAAIRALGEVGTLEDPRPLVRFLNAPDKQLRFEASLSLARLHAEQGLAGLERLALDSELEVRIRAVQAMGEIADRSFVPTLMGMLNDRHDVQRVAMISLAEIAGTEVAADVNGMPLSSEEKVRRWQLWEKSQPENRD